MGYGGMKCIDLSRDRRQVAGCFVQNNYFYFFHPPRVYVDNLK